MSSRMVSAAHQSSVQWVQEDISQEVKPPEREVDYSPPTSAEVKKTWVYTPTRP
jgi:hypothetical protein